MDQILKAPRIDLPFKSIIFHKDEQTLFFNEAEVLF